jgi:hypothetical protein
MSGQADRKRETMIATLTNPDEIFAFGCLCGAVVTWCVMRVADKLRQWDARKNR